MEPSTRLQIATVIGLGVVALVSLANLLAMDRLERQVIDTRQVVERLEAGGGGGGNHSAAVVSVRVPGSPTGQAAVGWGGKQAEILAVDGALPNAPVSLGQKPRPQGDTYVNRRSSPPKSLNFYTTSEGETSTVTSYILGRLIEVDLDRPPAVVPGLATSWEISPDHLTYTYHLRKGAQFADGRPFTAADVKFSFDVMRDPAVNAEHMRGGFEDVVELSTPDDYTVVVKYRQPYWRGLYTIGYDLRILNKGWYEENIPKYAERYDVASFSTEPGKPGFGDVFNKIRIPCPGTSAYYFVGDEYNPDQPLELQQNPFHWGIQVRPTWWNFRKLRWIFISDEVAAFEEFRKKKFDITVVDLNTWDDELSKDPTVTDIAKYYEYDHMGLAFSYIGWNTRKAPFDDPRVRTAMTHLTDREWIKRELERGRGDVAVCPSKPIYPNYNKDLVPHKYDLDEAKRLLAEAGWKDSDGDGVLDKDGKRFEFEVKVPSGRRFYTQVTAQLEDAAKKVGIRVATRPLEWATFSQDLDERNFDAVILYNSFADPWIDSYESFHSSQDVPRGGNLSGWHNPKADELLTTMRAEFDDSKRDAMYQDFCKVFYDEQPVTLLMHGRVGVLVTNRYEDVKVRPTGMQFFEFWVKPENVLNP